MPELSKDATDNLEKIVDHYGLENIVRALAFICSEKSTHIATNWQDVKLAKSWMQCSTILDGALRRLEDLNAEI
jgi:hypothetical protein